MVSLCFCFPPSAKIMSTRGEITMEDLKDSDKLITPIRGSNGQVKLKQTPFLSFLHYEPERIGEYLVLTCDNNSKLILSEDHLLFKIVPNGKWTCVRAKDVHVGDALVHLEDKLQGVSYPRVVSVDKRVIKGLYAPMTLEGTLLVDNFLVSCYANINSHEIAHAAFAPLRLWYRNPFKGFGNKGEKNFNTKKKSVTTNGIHKYCLALAAVRDLLPRRLNPE